MTIAEPVAAPNPREARSVSFLFARKETNSMSQSQEMQRLAALMTLKIDDPPVVEINSESAPRRIIGQLVRQGFVPSHRDAPENLKWLVEGEGDCNPDPSIHILDLLGCYRPGENKVIIYDLLIQR